MEAPLKDPLDPGSSTTTSRAIKDPTFGDLLGPLPEHWHAAPPPTSKRERGLCPHHKLHADARLSVRVAAIPLPGWNSRNSGISLTTGGSLGSREEGGVDELLHDLLDLFVVVLFR